MREREGSLSEGSPVDYLPLINCKAICDCPLRGNKVISFINIYRAFSLQGNVGGPQTLLRSCWGNQG